MWKESYRIGIERIDNQHMQLFKMADDLLEAVEKKKDKEEFKKVITFLKDYVVYHFKDEEEYQASIQYPDIEQHKKIHREFTATVLSYEKSLEESNYALSIVKDLAGTLTAWLIYHVANSDQKIATGETVSNEYMHESLLEGVYESTTDVLKKMAGISINQIEQQNDKQQTFSDGIYIKIDISTLPNSSIIVQYSKEFATKLFHSLTFIEASESDEMVHSALLEITNIIISNALTILSKNRIYYKITTPQIISEQIDTASKFPHHKYINTEIGEINIYTNNNVVFKQ